MTPFFSIIIPTLNEEKYLPFLLKNLERQSFKDFQIIIVDGGSTDKTKQIVEGYSEKLPIVFFRSEKKNVAFQRNYGAEKAKGKYLVFLDADSRINSGFLKKTFLFLENKKALIIVPYIQPDRNNPELKILFDLVNTFINILLITPKPFSSGGSMIVERNFFFLIGGFNGKLFLAEDHDLIQRAKKFGVTAKTSSKIKVKFNLRRMEKEGRLVFLYKSLLASLHIILKGQIKKKIFDYPMGGEYFAKKNKKNVVKEMSSLFNKFKSLIKNI